MRKWCVFAVSALTAGALIGFGAGPADAGDPTPRLKISTSKHGAFTTGVISVNVPLGTTQAFHLKAKSKGGAQDGTLEETVDLGSDYSVTYLRNGNDISDDVQTGGYDFRINSKAKRFKVRVETVSGPPAPDCLAVDLVGEAVFSSDTVGVEINGADCSF